MSIYKKLHEIQTRVSGLGKDSSSQSYKYVSGSKILSVIKPLMNELGLILKQEILSIENDRMDYQVSLAKGQDGEWKGKPKTEILSKVQMRFTWIDVETGEKDENLFGANGQNDWEKGLGSALTYAERYFLLKFFHIATDEDDVDNSLRESKIEELVDAAADIKELNAVFNRLTPQQVAKYKTQFTEKKNQLTEDGTK